MGGVQEGSSTPIWVTLSPSSEGGIVMDAQNLDISTVSVV